MYSLLKQLPLCFALLGFLLLSTYETQAQAPVPPYTLSGKRVTDAIKIDGKLTENVWQPLSLEEATRFVQVRPNIGQPSRQASWVDVVYDEEAIYIAARLYDTAPDSLRSQLGLRDQRVRNTEEFMVGIDPFKNRQLAYMFFVSVAGVQRDAIRTIDDFDPAWDAVWASAVQVDSLGWSVEIRIPYFTLRFPKKDVQDWGINFRRSIPRYGEASYWAPVDPNINNVLSQYGTLSGLEKLEPPLRLSVTPYVSTYLNQTDGGAFRPSMTGGMDLKYGLNESFTLDMALIPDFGQVRSDNVVLNLSPFEVRFSENRPFFTEGTELFNKGGLFYSRRVGSTYGRKEDPTATEIIDETSLAQQAPLLNASKISGRTDKGLGIGFFNAVTNRTDYVVEDTLTGETRSLQADPLTNFNVFVLDQNLAHNSSVSLVNTHVWREGKAEDANVTGFFSNLFDKKNTWNLSLNGVLSQEFIPSEESGNNVDRGYAYNVRVGKVSGNWQGEIERNVESDTYDINDLGFLRAPNEISHSGEISYRKNEPFSIFNNIRAELNTRHMLTYAPREFDQWEAGASVRMQFRNFWNLRFSTGGNLVPRVNHFEPRTDGYVFVQPVSGRVNVSVNSDQRKQVRVDMSAGVWRRPEWNQTDNWLRIEPFFQLNDRITLRHSVNAMWRRNEIGYINRLYNENDEVSAVIMGQRDIQNLTNTFSGSYTFNHLMGLTLRVRHYWSQVAYSEAFELTRQGSLLATDYTMVESDGIPRHDRNFNAFNIDLVYNWQFAPGSMLSFVWKNAIFTDDPDPSFTFADNLTYTLGSPATNSLSIRILYFLDYREAKSFLQQTFNS